MMYHRILAAAALGLGLAVASTVPAQASAILTSKIAGERGSAVYTDALNAFMAHGWHAVSDMKKANGVVTATGVDAQGKVRHIAWDRGSDKVEVK